MIVRGMIIVGLFLGVGCGRAVARPSLPPPSPPPGQVETPPLEGRWQLDEVQRRLDSVASRSDTLENALARLGARLEAMEQRVEQLLRQLAHSRVTSVPSESPLPSLAPRAGSPAPATPPAPPPTPERTAESLYQEGLAKVRDGETDAATLIFYDLIVSFPRHRLRESAQFQVGEILFAQEEFRGALREFEELLAAVPKGAKTADTLLKIGLSQQRLGDEASARRTWERLAKAYPGSDAARQARGLLRGAQRR